MLTLLLCQVDTVRFVVYIVQTIHRLAFLASRMASDVRVKRKASRLLLLTRG